ncbi:MULTISPECIES: DUF6460 domain-containing protein [Pseudovibrio]|uniref:DUF6460 domain-containing protein n=1 Tax=Stappiaceae TaxID=2821832 RepID=UPI00236647F5|nr:MULTISPECIES: DUF6460 domain-containing protein [Pseudovibrio]MDD7911132.1 DUF6460 domain-containing protein [Pseudovibrio exalbescens]MDX5593180.1 DUF6460 domain-containing protein [Pseudovibrio sp. SPO723]
MQNEKLTRFLGGSPGRVALRLVFLSFVVGIVLSALNISPLDIYYGIQDFFLRIWNMGFDVLGQLGSYLLIGAVVVIPIWFISRLLQSGKS